MLTFYLCRQGDTRENVKPPPAKSGAQRSSGGGVGMWLKLIFIISVAVLVYLVVINMNPSAENKIPLTLDEKND